jgi:hypothetical protein
MKNAIEPLLARIRALRPLRRGMKLVRRAHMFAGLLLLPWILFYGLSGILFNHPNVGEKLQGRPLPPGRLAQEAGFSAWQPVGMAEQVVQALNAARDPEAGPFALDPAFESRFSGPIVLKAPAPEGQHFVLLDAARGFGVLATRWARPPGERPPFQGLQLDLPRYSLARLEASFGGLLASHRLQSSAPLRADLKIAPHLELRMIDARGARWNVSYALADGTLSGRRADQWPSLGVSQLFAMLHTTHHYPVQVGARWFWAFFQDLLGVLMVFWAVTGVLMWWQMRPTRIAGAVSILLALGVAALVLYGTTREITFGHVPQVLGPGE